MYFLLSIGQSVSDAIRTVLGSLAAIIYNTIIWVYDLFEYIARAEILDNALVESIYNKVGLILGVFMLFKLIFSLVQSLIDPSKFSDKKNGFGQIIFRCIISIVLLGITPFLFKEAFQIQGLLIGTDTNKSDNVIYKLIVGTDSNNENQCESFGRLISSDLFFNFYTSDDPLCRLNSEVNINNGYATIGEDTCTGNLKADICKGSGQGDTNPFFATVSLLTDRNEADDYIIQFDSLYSIIVGGVILWILIVYCLQISIRVFQLAYLQLIAPIPILSYISDPDGSFKKWLKQCGSTFLDLFIRLALIYFIVYLSTYILGQFENANSILNESIKGISSDTLRVFLKVFIIMGLFLFAKRLPNLLKDLFPNLGGGAAGLGFGISPKKFLEDVKSTPIGWAGGKAAAVGRIGGKAVAGGIDSLRAGKGFFNGFKKNLPRPKFRDKLDELMPETAGRRKEEQEAKEQLYENQRLENMGRNLHNQYPENLKGAFDGEDGEYTQSYLALDDAKKKAREAEKAFDIISKQYAEEAKSGNISKETREAYERTKKEQKGYNDALEIAKAHHENLQKQSKYTRYAEMEKAYDYYKKSHYTGEESNNNHGELSQEPFVSPYKQEEKSNNNHGQWSQEPFVSPYKQEEIARNDKNAAERTYQDIKGQYEIESSNGTVSEKTQQAYEQAQKDLNEKSENYNKAHAARQQLDDDLDDFYDRQNDGFGGQ